MLISLSHSIGEPGAIDPRCVCEKDDSSTPDEKVREWMHLQPHALDASVLARRDAVYCCGQLAQGGRGAPAHGGAGDAHRHDDTRRPWGETNGRGGAGGELSMKYAGRNTRIALGEVEMRLTERRGRMALNMREACCQCPSH